MSVCLSQQSVIIQNNYNYGSILAAYSWLISSIRSRPLTPLLFPESVTMHCSHFPL